MSAANNVALATVPTSLERLWARRQRLILLWLLFLLLVLLGITLWGVTGESLAAQQVQEFVRWTHEQTIIDRSVSVSPRSFSSYEFTVPPGALDVNVSGEFSAAASPRHGNGSSAENNGVETYVLTDSAFAVWSSGYSAPALYQSASIANATIIAQLPSGAGVYHLVFSNKVSPRAKTVQANVLLRYKSWLPYLLVRMKERVWNWIGL